MELKEIITKKLFCRGEKKENHSTVNHEDEDTTDAGVELRAKTESLLHKEHHWAYFNADEDDTRWMLDGVTVHEKAEEEHKKSLEVPERPNLMADLRESIKKEDTSSNEVGVAAETEIMGFPLNVNIKEEPDEYEDECEDFNDDFITQSVRVNVNIREVNFQEQSQCKITSAEAESCRSDGQNAQFPESTRLRSFKPLKPDPSSSSIPNPESDEPPVVKKKSTYVYRYRPNRRRPARERAKIAKYPFLCTEEPSSCTKRFASELLLTGHIREEHLKLPHPYKCSECPKETNKFSTLVDHILSYHPGVVVISVCGRPYAPLKYKCDSCPRSFRDKSSLNNHIAVNHNPKEEEAKKLLPLECHVCEKRFKIQEDLTEHFDKIHKDNPYPFTCEDCQFVFPNSVSLRFHRKKAHPTGNRVMCEICKDRSFPSETHLKIHMGNFHRSEPISCPHCDFSTLKKRHFDRHKREAHEDLYASMIKCEVEGCGEEFKWRHQYKNHWNRKHSGKKFECSVCGKTFSSTISLRCHERIHAGLKYTCHICGMGVVTSGHLKRHLKIKHPEGTLMLPMTGRGPNKPKPHKWKKLPATVTSEVNAKPVSESVSSSHSDAGKTAEEPVMTMEVDPVSVLEHPIFGDFQDSPWAIPVDRNAEESVEIIGDTASATHAQDELSPVLDYFYPYQFMSD